MRIASCIVDVAARAVDRAFDYLVPAQVEPIEVGMAVSVDFGNRPVVAYVTGVEDVSVGDYEMRGGNAEKLKPLLGVLSDPYFDTVAAQAARWIAHEYLCPLSDAIHLFTPPGGTPKIKRVDGVWTLQRAGVGPVDDRWVFLTEEGESFEPKASAVKQRKVIEALRRGGMRVPELFLEIGQANSTLTALEKRGVVRIETRRRMRYSCPLALHQSTHSFSSAGPKRKSAS